MACPRTYGSASGVPRFARRKSGPRKKYDIIALMRDCSFIVGMIYFTQYNRRGEKLQILPLYFTIFRIMRYPHVYIHPKIPPIIRIRIMLSINVGDEKIKNIFHTNHEMIAETVPIEPMMKTFWIIFFQIKSLLTSHIVATRRSICVMSVTTAEPMNE